ncbi:hypothetical protein HU200_035452 [Digitaria exilis]|uniref:Uncharacterized protein n=1 Tax=Digitaria exilis TaxID=1010633 RepID=A0A835BG26_9POAL|nr:hypothetical protein HU200_035452 [Digitaria exilis]
MLLLRRHVLPFLRASSSFPSPVYHRACLLFNSKSTSAAAPFSLEDYLVAACGLAPAQARKTAKRAFDESSKDSKKAFEDLPSSRSRLHSASNPDAVLALLSGVGLSRADIAAVVTVDPLLLRSSPKNIDPRLLALRDRHGPLKDVVLHAEELGVPRSSLMFSQDMLVAASNTKETVAARLEFLKSTLGVCESKVSTAVSKMPTILGISEECLLNKIQFLKEVGLEPQFIVDRPNLLEFSLENRVVPRHRVMKALQAKGLLNSNISFYAFLKHGEQTFKLRLCNCNSGSLAAVDGVGIINSSFCSRSANGL